MITSCYGNLGHNNMVTSHLFLWCRTSGAALQREKVDIPAEEDCLQGLTVCICIVQHQTNKKEALLTINLLPSTICIYRLIGTDHKEEEEEEQRRFPRYFMLIEWQSICRVKKLCTGSKIAHWLKSWPLVGEEPCTAQRARCPLGQGSPAWLISWTTSPRWLMSPMTRTRKEMYMGQHCSMVH